MSTKAYVVHNVSSDPVPGFIERRNLRDDDVNIEILYCGICHTDLHMARDDWGITNYPFIGGHEIVGKVSSIGSKVNKFAVGDVVGVGCIVDSCEDCKPCGMGRENWCIKRVGTYNGKGFDGEITKGGYSQSIVVREKYVLRIPANLDLASSAPLLCAGITTYFPLKIHRAKAGKKVGVVGLGGLGSMAVKLAVAMGCEVTVFSRSHRKDVLAKEYGAYEVIVPTNKEELRTVEGKLDLIIDTVPFDHELDPLLGTLGVDGRYVVLGQIGPITMHSRSLMAGNRLVTGSLIGGIPETQEMLDFCGKHNITCDAEVISYDYITQAYKRVHKGDVTGRFVLDASTL